MNNKKQGNINIREQAVNKIEKLSTEKLYQNQSSPRIEDRVSNSQIRMG